MTRFAKIAGSVALVATMLAPAMASAYDDKDVIDYRQHLMTTLDQQSGALGQILSGVTPDKHAVDHLQVIALIASLCPKAFAPHVEGGQSKPDVWAKQDDFQKRVKSFVDGSAHVADVGKKQGWQPATDIVLDALPCKGCHDTYRDSSKK